jgi:hypothetical protein
MDVPDAADLVEDSIRALDEAELTDAAFHGDVAALYDFQSQYESRPTYFRIMEVLERRGYFVTIPLESHPDYDESTEALQECDTASVSPVLRRPGGAWSEEQNPVVGYEVDGAIYIERWAELWERCVEAGIVEGVEAEPPEERSLFRAVRDILEVTDRGRDVDLMLRWYVAVGFDLGFRVDDADEEGAALEELRRNPHLEAIREQIGEVEDLELKLAHPDRGLEVPPPALREAHELLSWWYGPI